MPSCSDTIAMEAKTYWYQRIHHTLLILLTVMAQHSVVVMISTLSTDATLVLQATQILGTHINSQIQLHTVLQQANHIFLVHTLDGLAPA
jgi:hypothetical protein